MVMKTKLKRFYPPISPLKNEAILKGTCESLEHFSRTVHPASEVR